MPKKKVIITGKELTEKEQLFIDEYFANGFNATKAHQKIYKYTYKQSKAASYRMMNKPHIKLVIDSIWNEMKDMNIVRREELLINLKEVMDKAIENDDNQSLLKAIDTINKMTGNYTTQIDATVSQTITLTIPGLELTNEKDEDDDEE